MFARCVLQRYSIGTMTCPRASEKTAFHAVFIACEEQASTDFKGDVQ
ncbi:MAG: hypothetical protein Q9P01_15890 [Anaerolineae bacterium]|nr:hypothetical protein [Anaerolineae bacterium]